MNVIRVFFILSALMLFSAASAHSQEQPQQLDCGLVDCPELEITDDPIDRACLFYEGIGYSDPCEVRGTFDPSIWQDAESGTLWMSYTWADLFFPVENDFELFSANYETHLARSDDAGVTWHYVATINSSLDTLYDHPVNGPGIIAHEVSDLVQNPDGSWTLLWLQYTTPYTSVDFAYNDPHIARRDAASAEQLAVAPIQQHLAGWGQSEYFPTVHNPSWAAGLQDCPGMTEPSIASDGAQVFVVVECISVDINSPDFTRQYERGTIELFEWIESEYRYIGRLLDYADAERFVAGEGNRLALTQPDLVQRRDGGWALLIVPSNDGDPMPYQGCLALDVADLASAEIARDNAGVPIVLASVTATSDHLGSGQCTYHPASETGILLHRADETPAGGVRLSIVATGVHP